MDILIFDVETDFKYLISQVEGQIKSKKLISCAETGMPIWQFHVEILNLDIINKNLLQIFCNLVQTSDAWIRGHRSPIFSFDS